MSIKQKFIPIFLNTGATALCSLFILIIASRYLDVASYGVYRQFYLACELVAPILGLGLAQSIYKFFSMYQKSDLLLKSMGAVFIACVLFWLFLINPLKPFLFILISGENLNGLEYVALAYLFVNIALPILMAFYVDSPLLKYYTIFNFFHVVFSAFIVSASAILLQDFHMMIYLRTGLMTVFFVGAFLFCLKIVKLDTVDNKVSMIALCAFSFPVGIASMVGVLSQHMDKAIVSFFESAEVYAIYANGAIEIPLISIVTGALGTASLVKMSKLCNEGKMGDALLSFHHISLMSSLVLFPAFVFFFINAEIFMIALFGEEFSHSANPFRVYLCLLPIRIVFYGTALVALGYSKVIMVRSLVELLINIILSILMYYLFGTIGVAIATVVTVYLWTVPFNLYKISSGFGVSMKNTLPYKRLGLRLGTVAICGPAAFLPALILNIKLPILVLSVNAFAYGILVLIAYHATSILRFQTIKLIIGPKK